MARQDSKPGRARSGWDVLTGLGAVMVLLVLVIGPPVALITVFGLPVPHTMPSASLLTHRLGTATVLKACSVVVWLAWLQLVWCVIAEVSAAVRNIGMPRRVPLAGGIQALVHRLVTTALLVSAAAAVAPALAPAAALAATPPTAAALAPVRDAPVRDAAVRDAAPGGTIPGQSLPPALLVAPAANGGAHRLLGPADVSQEFRPVTGSPGGNGTQAAAASLDGVQDRWAHRTEKIYVVKPPVGRFHESLWEIAENHLGDGRRYREIFELNRDLPQPDGSMLTIASLIRPGWVLRMPHDAYGPGIEEVKASPPARHSGRPHEPRPAAHPPAPGKHASPPAAVPPPQTAGADPAGAGAIGRRYARRVGPGNPGPGNPGPGNPGPRHLGRARAGPCHAGPGLLGRPGARRQRPGRDRPARTRPVRPGPVHSWPVRPGPGRARTRAVRARPRRAAVGTRAVRARPLRTAVRTRAVRARPRRAARPHPGSPRPPTPRRGPHPAIHWNSPPPVCLPRASWPPWSAVAASRHAAGRPAGGWSRHSRTPRGRRRRCAWARTRAPPGCWTRACVTSAAR